MVTKEEINKACDIIIHRMNEKRLYSKYKFGLCEIDHEELYTIIDNLEEYLPEGNKFRTFLKNHLSSVSEDENGYLYPTIYERVEYTYSLWYDIRLGWVEEIRDYLLSLIKE